MAHQSGGTRSRVDRVKIAGLCLAAARIQHPVGPKLETAGRYTHISDHGSCACLQIDGYKVMCAGAADGPVHGRGARIVSESRDRADAGQPY